MNEMYWITRLDGIVNFLCILRGIGIIVSVIFIVATLISYSRASAYLDDSENRNVKSFKSCKKILIYSIVLAIIFGTINTFIPTTKEAYQIIGIGGTYDYLKQNETAKQLPNKVINALDELLTPKEDKNE